MKIELRLCAACRQDLRDDEVNPICAQDEDRLPLHCDGCAELVDASALVTYALPTIEDDAGDGPAAAIVQRQVAAILGTLALARRLDLTQWREAMRLPESARTPDGDLPDGEVLRALLRLVIVEGLTPEASLALGEANGVVAPGTFPLAAWRKVLADCGVLGRDAEEDK